MSLTTAVDDLEATIQGVKEAFQKELAEAKEAKEAAEVDAMEKGLAQEAAEARVESAAFVVVETARRLHDEARHPDLFRVCRDRGCEAWADLIRDQGWGT